MEDEPFAMLWGTGNAMKVNTIALTNKIEDIDK